MTVKLRVLVLHPQDWSTGGYTEQLNVEVRHVSIGGSFPRRVTGEVTFDGIGDVATDDGLVNLYDTTREFKPHIFLFGIHFGITDKVIENVKRQCPYVKIVMHYTDQRSAISKFVKQVMRHIDLLLVTNRDKKDHQKYLDAGIPNVDTFYDGFSPYQYWPKPVTPKYDCLFGGNDFWGLASQMRMKGLDTAWMNKFSGAKFRFDFLKALNEEVELLIRGSYGWDRDRFFVQPMKYHPAYIDALREARILISTINYPLYGLVTRRMFRSIASGRLYITEYCRGMEDMFKNHVHLVWFSSIEEGLDLVKYYLSKPDEREHIAATGRAYLVQEHTFAKRLKQFIEICRRTIL